MNILDEFDMGITDEEIMDAAKEDEFEKQGNVSVSPEDHYIEFDSDMVSKKLKPFLQKKTVSRDIITRSLYLRISGTEVQMFGTDAVSYMSAKIPVTENNFPSEVIIDTESFAIVSKTHKVKTYLIERDGKFYSQFYGGELFIPSYKLTTEVYDQEFGEVESTGTIETERFRHALYSLLSVVCSSDIPELSYIFFENGKAYASNGVVVANVDCEAPEFVVRLSDVALIRDVLDSSEDSFYNIDTFESFYRIRSSSFSYTFPKVDVKLSDSYKSLFESGTGKYFINFPYFYSILGVLSNLPEFSGVIEVSAKTGKMEGIAKTKKGDVSNFEISTSCEGELEEGKFGVSLKALKVSLKIFRGEATIISYFSNGKLFYESGNKRCVIILKK